MNKNAAWAYDRAEYSKAGIPSRYRGKKKAESERRHVAAKGERLYSVSHSLVAIHKIIKMC